MEQIKKILMTSKGKKFFVKDLTKEFHTQHGYVSAKDLQKSSGSVVTTSKGKELFIMDPNFTDTFEKIKRGAQIITLKDVGFILMNAGLNNKSKVLDAGTGSGALACTLAHYAKKVVSYDVREDHLDIGKTNAEFFGLKNITFKEGDISKGVSEKDFDLITLDIPEPWTAIESAFKSLKPGGFIVSYNPCITQANSFVNAIRKDERFLFIKTSEVIEREWIVHEKRVRPGNESMGHTGFITIVRKILKNKKLPKSEV